MLQKMFNHRVFEDPLHHGWNTTATNGNLRGPFEYLWKSRGASAPWDLFHSNHLQFVGAQLGVLMWKSSSSPSLSTVFFPTSVKCKGMPDPHLSFGLRRHGCLAQQLSRLTQIGEYVISFHFCVYLRIAETLWDALNCKQPMPLYAISADCGCSRAVLVR